MTWRERLQPVRMQRVAVVAPAATLRDALVEVADAGMVELELPFSSGETARGAAGLRLQRLHANPAAAALAVDVSIEPDHAS